MVCVVYWLQGRFEGFLKELETERQVKLEEVRDK